jgi:hypothetical protein
VTATAHTPDLAGGSPAGNPQGDDLLAGVSMPRSRPLGIEVAAGRWLRHDDGGRALVVGLSGLMAALFGLPLLGLVTLAGKSSATDLITAALALGLPASAFGWLAFRRARAGLRLAGTGADLRGVLGSHQLALAEVDRFEPGVFTSLPLHREIGVKLIRRDGTDLDVWAMAAGSAATDAGVGEALAELQPLCDELNQLLDELKESANGD